jgi:hypothetical protein
MMELNQESLILVPVENLLPRSLVVMLSAASLQLMIFSLNISSRKKKMIITHMPSPGKISIKHNALTWQTYFSCFHVS